MMSASGRGNLENGHGVILVPAPPRDEPTTTAGLVLVELCLGDLDDQGEVFVGQFRVDDLVAVPGQEGRLDATWDGLPAVKEEDFHADTLEKTR
jgi:hypothetical protein